VKLGIHPPLMEFRGEGQSRSRLMDAVDAARECGLAAVSANDHFVFGTPWLDGLTGLAAAVERSGNMTLATTISLSPLRGPVPLAKALAALEPRPHQQAGIPIWIGSWGSDAGLSRVARLADGWLASAYNTTPERFGAATESLASKLAACGRDSAGFPDGLVTMWTWVTDDRADADRMLEGVLAPLLGRAPDELPDHLCIGSAAHCADVLSSYARAACEWVQLWPLGDERRQIELVAARVRPAIEG
jgi:alkanesulfonate monooxygenase SsuD/methylene tetrahydromethanopterin reductase-like flavin-dependent oxidoreductase (luciferase family)